MIEQGLFKNHFVGRDGFIWWIGQVVGENAWKSNIKGFPVDNNEEMPGFAERYKVRIMGYHSCATVELGDEELPWATVMYPVTAGGGGRGSSQNANITQGTFVFGFFIDGDQAQQPVIMGCLGWNAYQKISGEIPQDCGFIPFTGYTEKDLIPPNRILSSDAEQEELEQSGDSSPSKNQVDENASANSSKNISDVEMKADGQVKEALEIPSDCRKIPTAKMQQDIKNDLSRIKKIKRAQTEYPFTIAFNKPDFDGQIENVKKALGEKLSSALKQPMNELEKNTIELVNDKVKDKIFDIFPNKRQQLKEEVEAINDAIACQFRSLADGLEGMLDKFLSDALDKIVNVPPCFIDNMLGNMLGQLAQGIENSLNDILGGLNSLLPSGSGISIPGGEVMGMIQDVLSFLDCEQDPACSDITEWSLWDGPSSTPSMSPSNFSNIAGVFSDIFPSLPIPDLDLSSLPFGGILAAAPGGSPCDTGPKKCGPPYVHFWGGKGSGAEGNLIVSKLGEIMGYDPKSFGINYDEDTQATVIDDCGIGVGGVVEPILGDYTDDNGDVQTGVIDINVIQPGIDYLGQPDGSTGGDGEVWAKPDDTSIKHSDGVYEIPKPPGNVVVVVPGDEVLLPPGTVVETEPLTSTEIQESLPATPSVPDGAIIGIPVPDEEPLDASEPPKDETGELINTNGGEIINGGKPFICQNAGKFTTPTLPLAQPKGEYPITSSGAYPAILYLCDIIIDSMGINYQQGDEVVIEPNSGAKVEPLFNEVGQLISAKVTEPGVGFTEMPDIYIKSKTGINANLLPKFCVDRISADEVKEYIAGQYELVSVVDCVGVVPFPTPPPEEPVPLDTRRAYSKEAFEYAGGDFDGPSTRDLGTAIFTQVNDFTVEVTNKATGETSFLTNKDGINVKDIRMEDGVVVY